MQAQIAEIKVRLTMLQFIAQTLADKTEEQVTRETCGAAISMIADAIMEQLEAL